MALRPVNLIWLLCCTLTVLFTSLGGAQASSSCFSSAAAVKSAYPGTWPRWTYRGHSRDGVKCWYAATQAAAQKHQSRTVHHRDPMAHPKSISASVDNSPNWSAPITSAETSGAGWSVPVRAAALHTTPPPGQNSLSAQNSFAERFSAVFEVIFFESPSLMRRIEGVISSMQ